ncbi:MAG: hypothetical protein PHS17_18195 [Desulfobacterales bacterium]|nr:hypothetical protein [Desulfobacterales bacterium]
MKGNSAWVIAAQDAERIASVIDQGLVIDLAFKEPDGWVIADYKTDKVDGNLEKLVAYYKPQVEMYRKFWTEMSGEKVKEAGLYFIDIGEFIEVLG